MTNNVTEILASGSNDPHTLAKELIAATKVDQMVRAMTRQIMAQKVVSIQQKSEGADPEELKEVTTRFQYAFNDHVPELLEEIVKTYAQAFDVVDMKAVIAFHRSETGKRFEAGQQGLQAKTQKMIQKWTAHATQSAFEKATEQTGSTV